MTFEQFRAGMTRIESALQGKFEGAFMDFAWSKVSAEDADVWAAAVESLTRAGVKPSQLEWIDVERAVSTARGLKKQRAEYEVKIAEWRRRDAEAKNAPNGTAEADAMWQRIADKVLADPEATPEARRLMMETLERRAKRNAQVDAPRGPIIMDEDKPRQKPKCEFCGDTGIVRRKDHEGVQYVSRVCECVKKGAGDAHGEAVGGAQEDAAGGLQGQVQGGGAAAGGGA